MHTKPTKRADLEADIGEKDVVDRHPLIVCAPHILQGHAHLKNRKIFVERVLAALLKERRPGPLSLRTKGGGTLTITDEEVRATLRYAIDIFENLSQLYAELDPARRVAQGQGLTKRGGS